MQWRQRRVHRNPLDVDLADYLDAIFADGRPAGEGEKVVAPVVGALPGLDRRSLVRAFRAVRGFRKACPA
eukprot:1655181-Lingulodinium_polyedra.AAC.1